MIGLSLPSSTTRLNFSSTFCTSMPLASAASRSAALTSSSAIRSAPT